MCFVNNLVIFKKYLPVAEIRLIGYVLFGFGVTRTIVYSHVDRFVWIDGGRTLSSNFLFWEPCVFSTTAICIFNLKLNIICCFFKLVLVALLALSYKFQMLFLVNYLFAFQGTIYL